MSEYIFDAIDSDKKRRYIYVEYIDKASRNFFITLQHIYKCVKGENPPIFNDYFENSENTDFMFDYFTRAEDRERLNLLLNKHFPFLRVIEYDFNETDKIGIIKKFWEFFKVLCNAAKHDVKFTNSLYANNKADILRWLRTDIGSGHFVKKRGIAIAAKKEMKNRFLLTKEPKPVFYFLNNCGSPNGEVTFRSFLIFVSLFLEDIYSYQFITTSELKSNFFYKERNRQGETNLSDFKKEDFLNLYRALSIYNINLPADKYDAQYDKINNLGLYIINELQKCPHELFEHISLKDQNKFRVQGSDNADYPEDILLKRFQDRFATLVLRYIDTQKLFKDIRFQVSLGKYRFKFYDKQCIDADSADRVRILQKELKTFGRLDDMEEKRRTEWADVLRLTDLENQAVADTADTEPYITDQITRYNIDKHTPKIPLWWDGDCPLPITKDQVKQGQKVAALNPKAFLSVYDLPAMMFLHFLGGNPEKLIKEYYNSYIQLFADIRDGILTPDNYSESDFVQKYKINLCDVPKELQNYLLRKKTTMPERFQGVPSRLVKKSLLEDFKTDSLAAINKKIEKVLSEPQNLKSGKMADYLAKSIVNLLKDNKIKPTGKNFSVMQANLAVYESFDKINQMLTRSKIADNHPFLKKVLARSPQKTLDFYKFYLNEEKTFFSSNDNFSYLKVYKYRTTKYDEKGATYYKSLANHYISNGFVELTNHIFADEIRAKLSGKIADIDAADTKYNIAFLISRYYKESQPFYSFNREYKISQLNKKEEPKEKIDFYIREQKNNEKAINRYRVQDKILFEMAKTLLKEKDDATKAQICDIAEMTLSNIMPGDNVFDKPMQNFSVTVNLDGRLLTITTDNIKVKNYSTVFKTIFDRRLDTLAKLITTPHVSIDDIKAELELYDREVLKINKLVYDADDVHRAIPFVKAIRNCFAHWSYPHKDALRNKNGVIFDANLTNLHNKLVNKSLGEKVVLIKPELEMALM